MLLPFVFVVFGSGSTQQTARALAELGVDSFVVPHHRWVSTSLTHIDVLPPSSCPGSSHGLMRTSFIDASREKLGVICSSMTLHLYSYFILDQSKGALPLRDEAKLWDNLLVR